MTPGEAQAWLEARRAQALERSRDAARVEAAFKLEAVKAQRAYIRANRLEPYTEATLALDQLHRQAVRQWAQAQADAGRARRSLVALNSTGRLRAADGARRAAGVRNGDQVHSGSARPLEGHHGLPA